MIRLTFVFDGLWLTDLELHEEKLLYVRYMSLLDASQQWRSPLSASSIIPLPSFPSSSSSVSTEAKTNSTLSSDVNPSELNIPSSSASNSRVKIHCSQASQQTGDSKNEVVFESSSPNPSHSTRGASLSGSGNRSTSSFVPRHEKITILSENSSLHTSSTADSPQNSRLHRPLFDSSSENRSSKDKFGKSEHQPSDQVLSNSDETDTSEKKCDDFVKKIDEKVSGDDSKSPNLSPKSFLAFESGLKSSNSDKNESSPSSNPFLNSSSTTLFGSKIFAPRISQVSIVVILPRYVFWFGCIFLLSNSLEYIFLLQTERFCLKNYYSMQSLSLRLRHHDHDGYWLLIAIIYAVVQEKIWKVFI